VRRRRIRRFMVEDQRGELGVAPLARTDAPAAQGRDVVAGAPRCAPSNAAWLSVSTTKGGQRGAAATNALRWASS
jgi:hypothetical protein